MIGNSFARLSGSKRNLIALVASSAIITVGCSNMVSTAPSSNPLSVPASLSGNIHGGNQPVSGATVTLWYAGQSAHAILAATATTSGNGFFSFTQAANGLTESGTTSTFSCPTSSDPLVYVIGKGGNTQNNGVAGQSNTAAAFIGIYGVCSSLSASSFISLSEVTTVATMAAVSQFFNPADDTISADGTGQQKIIVDEIPNTIALLANMSTGLANTSTTISRAPNSNVSPGVTVTATPEPGKVNLLADIISACINAATASATPCTTLFSAAVPPVPSTTSANPGGGFSATTVDTLQALYYIFTNPTNSTNAQGVNGAANIAALTGLAGGVGAPYQPFASQPTDWTIGISYSSTSSCGTATGGTGGFISSPVDINIDSADTVWFANAQTGGNLSAITAGGAPIACINFDSGASNAGGVLDSIGNVWFAGGTTLYRFNQGLQTKLAFPVGVSPLGITADGLGNVYFTAVTSGTGSLYQLTNAANVSSAVSPVQISNTVGPNPVRLMPDFKSTTAIGNIWVSSGSTYLSQVTPGSGPGSMGGFITTTVPAFVSGTSYGVSVDAFNTIVTSTSDTGVINSLSFNGTNYVTANGWPVTVTTAGILNPTALTVDGRMNIWIPNSGNGPSTGSVSELNYAGNGPLSPATGYQKSSAFLHSGRASVVDQAGNVWIAGDGNNFVTEIVGAGVPIYQPYAVGLSNGRFQQIP
jgi:hypothetical protein